MRSHGGFACVLPMLTCLQTKLLMTSSRFNQAMAEVVNALWDGKWLGISQDALEKGALQRFRRTCSCLLGMHESIVAISPAEPPYLRTKQEDADELLRKMFEHDNGFANSIRNHAESARLVVEGVDMIEFAEHCGVWQWQLKGNPSITFTEEEASKIKRHAAIERNAEPNGYPSRITSLFHGQSHMRRVCTNIACDWAGQVSGCHLLVPVQLAMYHSSLRCKWSATT